MPEAQIITEEDFKGMNVRDVDITLKPGFLKNCTNLVLDKTGGLALRKGYLTHSTVLGTTPIICGLSRYKKSDATVYPIAFVLDTDSSITNVQYYSGGAWNNITTPAAAGNYDGITISATYTEMRGYMLDNLLIILRASGGRPLCWDGTNDIALLGVDPPTDAEPITATPSVISGSMEPDLYYWYAYAYKNSTYGFISEIWKDTGATAIGSKTSIEVKIPANASLDPGVDKVILYRSVGQATEDEPSIENFYFLSEEAYVGDQITPNDGAHDDTIKSNATLLSEHLNGYGDHALAPDDPVRACVHKSRFFMVDKESSDLYYSRPGKPAYYPTANHWEIDPDDGSNLDNIADLEMGVALFKGLKCGILDTLGADDNWEFRTISEHGILALDTLRTMQHPISGELVAIRLANDGVFMTNGRQDIEISQTVWALIAEYSKADLATFAAYYAQTDKMYVLEGNPVVAGQDMSGRRGGEIDIPGPPQEPGADAGVKGFIFHLDRPLADERGRFDGFQSTLSTLGFTHNNDWVDKNNEIIYASNKSSAVYTAWTGFTDDAVGIQTVLTLRPLNPSGMFGINRFLQIFIRMQTLSDTFDLYYNIDNDATTGFFGALSSAVAETHLDLNIYDKLDVAADAPVAGGSLTDGLYKYRYRYADTNNPRTMTQYTESSDISDGATTSGSDNTVEVQVPAYNDDAVSPAAIATAYDAGYRYALLYRKDPSATKYYFLGAVTLIAAGTIPLVYSDDGTVALIDEYELADPVAELQWEVPSVKAIVLPSRGGEMKARAKGEFIVLTCSGANTDPDMRYVGFGLKYVQLYR